MAFPFEARGVVDGDMSDDPYLPDQPQTLLSNGDFNQVKKMKGLWLLHDLVNPSLNSDYESQLDKDL